MCVVPPPPPPPPPPPQVQANPELFRNPYKANRDILLAAKASLRKVVPIVEEVAPEVPAAEFGDGDEHSYALANPPSPALEVSVDSVNPSMEGNTSSGESLKSQPKKAKLLADLNIVDENLSSSPELPHKLPSRKNNDSEVSEESENSCEKSNLYGINFIMWFDVGIEGKSSMDQEEEDWGGRLEFGFSDASFPKDVEDYFLMFEDECTQSHFCAGRVMGVLSHVRKKAVKPPDYDLRNIVDLVDKYRDAHINDSGWREVDPEEWYADH